MGNFKKFLGLTLMGMGDGLTGGNTLSNYIAAQKKDPIDKLTESIQLMMTNKIQEQANRDVGQATIQGQEPNVSTQVPSGLLGVKDALGAREELNRATTKVPSLKDINLRIDPRFGTIGQKLGDLDPAQLAEIEVAKQADAKIAKERQDVQRNTISASTKQSVVGDVWLDMLDQGMEQSNLKPGVGLGTYITATGKMKWNDFYEAFEGTSNEYGAAVARIAMPNTRAVRAIEMFKAGKPSQFSTVESGVQNMRRTYENIITNDMSSNPESYIPDFKNTAGDRELLNAMVKRFGEKYEQGMVEKVYNKNPKLLRDGTAKKYGLDSSEIKMTPELQKAIKASGIQGNIKSIKKVK